MAHVIVWDIETVPDLAGFAAANRLTGNPAEVRALQRRSHVNYPGGACCPSKGSHWAF